MKEWDQGESGGRRAGAPKAGTNRYWQKVQGTLPSAPDFQQFKQVSSNCGGVHCIIRSLLRFSLRIRLSCSYVQCRRRVRTGNFVVLSKTLTVLSPLFTVARSGRPSWLKSATTNCQELVPTGKRLGFW